jgi:hypothetical protein
MCRGEGIKRGYVLHLIRIETDEFKNISYSGIFISVLPYY